MLLIVQTDELAGVVEALAQRVARLEGAAESERRDSSAIAHELLRRLAGDGSDATGTATVVYAGAGPWEHGAVAWQMGRSWDDVTSGPVESVARALSALANGTRLRIVVELLRGRVSTGELADRLDQPSPGQLFHHLKELLAAGVIHQPERGTYAIRRPHVVPLLAVLSAAVDLAAPADEEKEPA
jgi:DNA-binding transcriptional ArsR family regulator